METTAQTNQQGSSEGSVPIRPPSEESLRGTHNVQTASPINSLRSIDELEKLLKRNVELTEQLIQMTSSIKRWVMFQRVWGIFKLLLILIPLIIGAIYLPPLLAQWLAPYRELFSGQNLEMPESFFEQFRSDSNGAN